MRRRGRYKEMISRIFREEGVPQDLVFLAQAESGFQPLALSHAGARGMWQFMPFDGLQSPASSATGGLTSARTRRRARGPPPKASARPLQPVRRLVPGHGRLQQVAPEPCSERCSAPATPTSGSCTSATCCRGETRNYVPIILAMTIMAKNPSQYGLDHVSPRAAPALRDGSHPLSH